MLTMSNFSISAANFQPFEQFLFLSACGWDISLQSSLAPHLPLPVHLLPPLLLLLVWGVVLVSIVGHLVAIARIRHAARASMQQRGRPGTRRGYTAAD